MAEIFLLAAVLLGSFSTAGKADFKRGDVNRDHRVDISDVVSQVLSTMDPARPFACEDSADTDDNGVIDLADAVRTLRFLFVGDETIANPGPHNPGPDPTCDRLSCDDGATPTPAVVINEIQFNPPLNEGQEYIELFNRTHEDLDIGGYRFTQGVDFTLPEGSVIPARGFLIVARDPESSIWRRVDAPVVGPYAGVLSNDGERLTVFDGDCLVESVRYDDRFPWPVASDGYGFSLERIDPLAPADDHHSWRASTQRNGSAGAENSTLGTPTHPVIIFASVNPESPTSGDAVEVRVSFDVPPERIASVRLTWEGVTVAISDLATVNMERSTHGETWVAYRAVLPPRPSQSLVRYRFDLLLGDGTPLTLPHPGERVPFLSYFVYDGELTARLPILWLFPYLRSAVAGGSVSGVVVQEVDVPFPFVLDGAWVFRSEQGQKVRFVKGAEFRGDRTINIIPETGGGGSGMQAPHMEHLGFNVFRELGALAPWAEWFRVIDFTRPLVSHTQNLVVEQVNERFFAMNGLDPNGDIYKLDKNVFRKQNNLETGLQDFLRTIGLLRSGNAEVRRQTVMERLDLDSVCMYSAVSVLIENWDGFHNNLFVYDDLSPGSRLQVIPWDLDQVFESCCFDFPLDFPRTGQFGPRSREAGPISRGYHLEPDLDLAYRDLLRGFLAEDGLFSVENIGAMMDHSESLLLEDLALQEEYLGAERAARRNQIQSSYRSMRGYLERRIPFLRAALDGE